MNDDLAAEMHTISKTYERAVAAGDTALAVDALYAWGTAIVDMLGAPSIHEDVPVPVMLTDMEVGHIINALRREQRRHMGNPDYDQDSVVAQWRRSAIEKLDAACAVAYADYDARKAAER